MKALTEEEQLTAEQLVEEKSIAELVEMMADAKAKYEKAKAKASDAYQWLEILRLVVIPNKMEQENLENVTTEHGRVHLVSDLFASIPAPNREAAHQWLQEKGLGELIKPTVNASSLKAAIKELMKEGEEIPEDIFKVTPITRAQLTRKR